MKWFVVALMFNSTPNQVGTDIFGFTQYPFTDEITCRGFLIKNKKLAVTIASAEYEGRPVQNVVCVNEVKLLEWINGTKSI